jgi:hypothetical protein
MEVAQQEFVAPGRAFEPSRGRGRRAENVVAVVALEHGGTWHYQWTETYGLGFESSVVVAQRRKEPLEGFHARIRRVLSSVRGGGSQIAVGALCVSPATTSPFIAPRFRIASALIADLSGNSRRLILAAADDSPPVAGHLSALADALREAVGPRVVIDVCVGREGAPTASE